MDELIGFVIFVVIAAASVIKRVYEAQQEEEKRRSLPGTRPEDLPEATRRMLYGDTQVPTARERETPVQPTVIVARPRQLEDSEEGPRRAPRPVVAPPTSPRPMQPQRTVVAQRRTVFVPPARPTPQRPAATTIPTRVARESLPGDRGTDFDTRAALDRTDGEWVMRGDQERRQQVEQAQRMFAARARAAQKRRVFTRQTDLRRAIVLNELLGPPVALRDPFGPFQGGSLL